MKTFKIPFFILFIFSIFFFHPLSISAEPPVTILVFPFTIHAPDDQTFLKQAVMDMLYTRLSAKDRDIVLEPDPATGKQALEIGRDSNADYILMGSLTLLGESVSTDARLIRTADQKSLITFNRSGQGHGAIIEHVDALATQITQDVFGPEKSAAPSESKPRLKSKPADTLPKTTGMSSDQPAQLINLSYWKSENFKTEIHSLTIGDVDGDGRNETVFVDGSNIYVYRYSENMFLQVEQISERSHNQFIRVDAADINQNGMAEIFVTNYIPSQNRLQSFVLEWNGAAYKRISEKAKWYYRVIHHPEQGATLLGQKAGPWRYIVSVQDALFENGIHELQWRDGSYLPAGRQHLPNEQILYGYATGDVANKGPEKIVAFSKNNNLTILNQKGDKEWESDEHYGGSTLFFEVPNPDIPDRMDHFYLPQRIYIVDFDKDGSNEIIVVKNHDAAAALVRMKYFKEGAIECLSYDDIGTQLKWETRKISGYISDYAIGDFDNDGRNDLVFASVAKGKSAFKKGLSTIISCALVNR